MIPYDRFRTGLTFTDVRGMLAEEQVDPELRGERKFVTRATVLGRWHEIKLTMYEYYQRSENETDDKGPDATVLQRGVGRF